MNIKQSFLIFFRLCLSSDYRYVRRLAIFDADYYCRLSGDQHTCRDDLDTLWDYLKMRGSDRSLLLTIGSGWRQLPQPHPLFDSSFYLGRYFPSGLAENPFVHYLRQGWKEGLQPGPFFDTEFYRAKSGWQEDDGDPLTHYTHHGAPKGISPGPYFDVSYYADNNVLPSGQRSDIIKHYKLHGANHGKSPIPLFDPGHYLAQLENDTLARPDPLSHFISSADSNRLRPARWFDPKYYRDRCPVNVDLSSTLAHYLTVGLFQQAYPDPRVERLPEKPVISIIMLVNNPDVRALNNCIRSVFHQAYPHWELCLANGCSRDDGVRSALEEWARRDPRIKLTLLPENPGISDATNAAAALAAGEYLGFIDSDDEVPPQCLFCFAEVICRHAVDLIYSDEDLIADDGNRLSVYRKPDYNGELLLSHNYIAHFVVVSQILFQRAGGLDARYDGAQDFDLLLRLTELADRIYHIPRILYHRRKAATPHTIDLGRKGHALDAGKRALAAALERREYAAAAEKADPQCHYRLRYTVPHIISVTLLIWSEVFESDDIERLTQIIRQTSYQSATLVFVSASRDVSHRVKRLTTQTAQKLVVGHHCVDHGTSKALAMHQAAVSSTADCIVFVDSSITAIDNRCLVELLGPFGLDDVGIVCGRIFTPGGSDTSSIFPDLQDGSSLYYQSFLQSSSCHLNGPHCFQEVSFCGWQLTMIDRDLYMGVGGLDWEVFPEVMAMADLSLKIHGKGRKILYTPYANIQTGTHFHGEKSKLKNNKGFSPREKNAFLQKWGKELQGMDPFYNRGVLRDMGIDENLFERWFTGTTREGGEQV